MITKPKSPKSAVPLAQPGAGIPPATNRDAPLPASAAATDGDIAAFVEKMQTLAPAVATGQGRLVFAMDATMSRAPTWDLALKLQAGMFAAVRDAGGLDVQLVYFRGIDECRASKWVSNADALARLMTTVACHGGLTQLGKVLRHARDESTKSKVSALVYVGDAMEEDIDHLCARAGELALLGVPVFLFQEGHDASAARAFREIARMTHGAHCTFDAGSAKQLRDLLTAVAVYAAGGTKALLTLRLRGSSGAKLLLTQMNHEKR
jgi:hypothetical protein